MKSNVAKSKRIALLKIGAACAMCALAIGISATHGRADTVALPPGATAVDAPLNGSTFSFELEQAAPLTSAGVYDANGKLVRVLWTMKPLAAGVQQKSWDGLDDLGKPLPADGQYTYKVVVNRATYKNVGVIGTTAFPTNTSGHVPTNFEAVAVDSKGNVYTVHDWDEPHFDVIRWSPQTGHSIANSGHPFGGLAKAIAVDDQHAYVSEYEDLNPANPKFYIHRLLFKPDGSIPLDPFTKTGGPIPVYNGSPLPPIPSTTPEDDGLRRVPLLSLAVAGDTLYAVDARADKVHLYDKVTGEEKSAISVTLPQTVAVAPDGRVWVGHEHAKVSVFDADGNLQATPINDIKEINAIAFGPDGTLYVADQGANCVKIYGIAENVATLKRTLGQKAGPGDRAADHFAVLHGVAVDKQGNIITVQHDYQWGASGRVAKFTPAGKLMWEQLGLEFQSVGNYNTADPDTFYSMYFHSYQLDRKTNSWKFLGNTDPRVGYHSNLSGVPRAIRIGKNDFFYMPTGNGVQVYRIIKSTDPQRGPTFKLVSVLGHTSPNPTGGDTTAPWEDMTANLLWSWHDEQGDGTPQPDEITYSSFTKKGSGDFWQYGPMNVDANKNIWFSSYDGPGRVILANGKPPERTAIYMIPPSGLDKQGNPIYEWDKIKAWLHVETPWEVQAKMVQHTSDGSTYIYASTQKYPNAPQSGGLHMGANMLLRYDKENKMQWMVKLPEVAVGMDAIPGGQGGCVVGGQPWGGIVHQYSRDGLLMGAFGPDLRVMGEKPNNPSGLLDMYAAIAVNRDPRDGLLDVFVEDDYNLRIAWYRVDDRNVQTLTGQIEKP